MAMLLILVLCIALDSDYCENNAEGVSVNWLVPCQPFENDTEDDFFI